MSFLVLATFKSNKTSTEVKSWLVQVAPIAAATNAQVALAPSFPYLSIDHWPLSILRAAQDVSPFPPGSYTGAVNAVQLKDLGVKYCLVGHSERRKYFHESSADVANKINELIEVGITPVLCLAKADIEPQLATLTDEAKASLVLVYEPPADIGGTETAPLEDIATTVSLLRSLVPGRPVLYGGSVNAGNLESLISLGVDGVLVSTASLNPQSFVDLLNRFQAQG